MASRIALAERSQVDLPGDRRLQEAVDWGKQNLADLTQTATNLQLRFVDRGTAYPAPITTLDRVQFVGAGYPDYPWLFATDGEYTAFASVALGQFEAIKAHLIALRDVSDALNDRSGKVAHEIVSDGSIYFGANRTRATPTSRSSSRAPSRSCGAGPVTTSSATNSMTSRAARCATSRAPSTSTRTAGPRASATSSAKAWARRSSITPST